MSPSPRPPTRAAPWAAALLGPVAALLASTHWYGWQRALDVFGAGDVRTYERIAAAALSLPDGGIGSAYGERFASHWLAGALADALGLSLPTAYRALVAVALAGAVLALAAAVRRIGLEAGGAAVVLALVVLAPMALRPFLLVPGLLQDLVLIAGVAVLLLGLVAARPAVVCAGLALAIAGRQTALLVAPAAAVWIFAGGAWRARAPRRRAGAAVLALLVTGGLYAVIVAVSASFTHPFSPQIPGDTVLPLLDEPSRYGDLARHAGRVAEPLAVPAGLLLGAWLARRRIAAGRPLPVELWLALLVAAAIVVQPLAIGPDFPGYAGNEERLAVQALPALAVALAFLLADTERLGRLRPAGWGLAALLGVLALASLRDRFSLVGPGGAAFAAGQILAAAACAWLLAGPALRAPGAPAHPGLGGHGDPVPVGGRGS